MPLGRETGLGLSDIVLDGDPAPPRCERGTTAPSFRPMSIVATVAHLSYCFVLVIVAKRLDASCNKMPLGTEVGLGLRDIVFDVDPANPRKRAHPPHPILAHVYCGQMDG